MDANNPQAIRRAIRSGQHKGNTSGLARGFVQANLAILPSDWAADFLLFCQLNPKPCPLVGVASNPGDFQIDSLGADLDIRTDVPRYRVFENGECVNEVEDIQALWRDDLVTFALGCSFSFEEALLADGLEIRNITEGVNVPMYRTNIACKPAGRFSGDMVVSMRPMKPADAIRAIQICSRFPSVHGAPVHFGDPAAIGIQNIDAPDFGDAVSIRDGEVPVFWACGVTPQVVLEQSRPPFCITHSPGHMLVTDLPNSKLSVF
ncbi:putative hydro-lyase [Marinobacterium sp. AK62]|uniref:Putative hydro-lyase H9C73_01425 n=1 Tax=Marinobacterium alkalitolerans TaxID=1542925 RepID=A0ABS3Z6Q6_9GAMM|nr:putative hydro-lyase [Marinobacterium alkalitolerans]MBP0047380.1 putative hydro-lyase [Marinobacterium alkalitolerans]